MKKRTYWMKYGDFGNVYNVVWEWNDNIPELEILKKSGYEKITRKKAIEMCVQERYRAKYDSNSSGYAPTYITHASNPLDYSEAADCIKSGYIIDV